MRRALVLSLLAIGCGSSAPATPIEDAGAGTDAPSPPPRDAASPMDAAGDARAVDDAASATYDDLVLSAGPVAFWDVDRATGTEPDRTGNGNDGTYVGGKTQTSTMPNGDPVAVFDGATQYVTVPSKATLSVPTTHELTWEGWIRPDVLQFPNANGGYVDWMGKCASYSPTCEWEARMYTTTNAQGRCNRMSAYVFNPSAGLGSAADWQPVCGLVKAGSWYHVVGEYTTKTQPATCPNSTMYPGMIDIWVNGVRWDQAAHNPTGCMSQYSVIPVANDSPLTIGTMAKDSWFPGAIGKVAVYDRLLDAAEIASHYRAMTGQAPSGTCADTCSIP